MKFEIGTLTNIEEGTRIDIKRSITEEEFNKIINSIHEIGNIDSNIKLFDLVMLNKNSFLDTAKKDFKEMIESSMKIQGDREKYDRHYLNFNRLFLNYLSSIKSFIDHNKTLITREFGSSSSELELFIKKTNFYFDNYFCYRFFSKLRDYSQHYGLPLQDFNLVVERNIKGGVDGQLTMDFNPTDLLSHFSNWGKIVTNDLINAKNDIYLLPLIEAMTKVLFDFLRFINDLFTKKVCEAAKYLKLITDPHRGENIDICLFSNFREDKTTGKLNFEIKQIPIELVDKLDLSSCG